MGKSKTPQAEAPNPVTTAQQSLSGHQATDPGMASLNYQIQADPNYGASAMSRLYQDAYNQLNPGAQGLKNDLYSNLTQTLNSPYSVTPEQQQAVQNIRQRATEELMRSLNTQANLGGGLYGGGNFNQIGKQVGNLQDQFANEDITLQQQADQRNKAFILQLMGINPEPGVQLNNFNSSVADPNVIYNGQLQANMANNQAALQAQANKNSLYSSLFQGLGTAAGGALGGPLGATIGNKLSYIAPGGYTPNTPQGVQNMGAYSTLGR